MEEKIIKKYLTGSRFIGLENCHDYDYLIICDKTQWKRATPEDRKNKQDNHYWTIELIKKSLNFEDQFSSANWDSLSTMRALLVTNVLFIQHLLSDVELCKSEKWVNKELFFNNKNKYKDGLLWAVQHNVYNLNYDFMIRENMYCNCTRRIYNVMYTLYILLNGDFYITEQQKQILQTIHDNQMPLEFLKEIPPLINQL